MRFFTGKEYFAMNEFDDFSVILPGHGGGGVLTHRLIEEVILPALDNPLLRQLDDSTCVVAPGMDLAITTDSYVVSPLFFPGGDIGRLAVCGTVNDLAMQGARPLWLTLGLILEEGLAVSDLRRVLESMGRAAAEAGVQIVAGDTKVVERGKGWGVFVNTAGVGVRRAGVDVHVGNARPGDAVLVTGAIGEHGVAVMSKREGIGFDGAPPSDVAPLAVLVGDLLDACPGIHCLRDPTRGGLTAALCDIARASGVGIRLRESAIPIEPAVQGACDLLGLDPLNVANEGKAVVVCDPDSAEAALEILRRHPRGRRAARVGFVATEPAGRVLLETAIGGERLLAPPTGEDLPRIC